jgi:hypothetical protein
MVCGRIRPGSKTQKVGNHWINSRGTPPRSLPHFLTDCRVLVKYFFCEADVGCRCRREACGNTLRSAGAEICSQYEVCPLKGRTLASRTAKAPEIVFTWDSLGFVCTLHKQHKHSCKAARTSHMHNSNTITAREHRALMSVCTVFALFVCAICLPVGACAMLMRC